MAEDSLVEEEVEVAEALGSLYFSPSGLSLLFFACRFSKALLEGVFSCEKSPAPKSTQPLHPGSHL